MNIAPKKNNYPDLTQNLKKFYSINNKVKALNNLTNNNNNFTNNDSSNTKKPRTQTSESSENNTESKEAVNKHHHHHLPLTEEIEKEANFLISSNESDSSESTANKLNTHAMNGKPSKLANAIATAKIINVYPSKNMPHHHPHNHNIASVKLSQQQSLPFSQLDLKNNPLIPIRNIKLPAKVAAENESLYTKLLREKSIESLKKKKYFSNLHNKSLLSSTLSTSSSSSSNTHGKNYDLKKIQAKTATPPHQQHSSPHEKARSYLASILNAADKSQESNYSPDLETVRKRQQTPSKSSDSKREKQPTTQDAIKKITSNSLQHPSDEKDTAAYIHNAKSILKNLENYQHRNDKDQR